MLWHPDSFVYRNSIIGAVGRPRLRRGQARWCLACHRCCQTHAFHQSHSSGPNIVNSATKNSSSATKIYLKDFHPFILLTIIPKKQKDENSELSIFSIYAYQ
jgi:hypothetical protein